MAGGGQGSSSARRAVHRRGAHAGPGVLLVPEQTGRVRPVASAGDGHQQAAIQDQGHECRLPPRIAHRPARQVTHHQNQPILLRGCHADSQNEARRGGSSVSNITFYGFGKKRMNSDYSYFANSFMKEVN